MFVCVCVCVCVSAHRCSKCRAGGPFNVETFLEATIDGAAALIADKDIDLLYWINSDVPLQLIGVRRYERTHRHTQSVEIQA